MYCRIGSGNDNNYGEELLVIAAGTVPKTK